MRKAFEFAASLCWLIEPSYLATILAIANGEGPGPQAVAARLGRPLQNAPKVEIRDGVAIVPVHGPIFRRASLFTDVSGATSVSMLARDFRAALESPEVSAIVLDIDSPGGEANGIHELAAMIRDARGQKPICAYVGGMAASAAYWIASACEEIVADDTALVGSIGTVLAVPAPGATSSSQVEFVSSVSPYKRPDLGTKDGRAQYQKRVDDNAAVFVENVARNRAVTPDQVAEKFGKGGLLMAREALTVGMIDKLGSFEGTVARFAAPEEAPPSGPASEPPPGEPCSDPTCACPCHDDGDCTDPNCECACHEGMSAQARNSSARTPAKPTHRHPSATAAAHHSNPEKHMSVMISLVTVASVLGLAATAKEAEVTAKLAEHKSAHDKLLEATGKSNAANALLAIEAMKANAQNHAAVAQELAELKAAKREGEVTSILDAAQKAGKVPPAKRSWALGLAGADADGKGADPERLKALVDGLDPVVATGAIETGATGASSGTGAVAGLTAEDLKVCEVMKIDPKEFAAEKAKLTAQAQA